MTRQDMIEIGYLPKPLNSNYMKLKFFNPETVAAPPRIPDAHLVVRKSGAISFTKPAEKVLDLKVGTKVEFCQNEDNQDWYLFKSSKGFPIKDLGQQIGISCKKMAETLWMNKGEQERSRKFLISLTPMNYNGTEYFLLTASKK